MEQTRMNRRALIAGSLATAALASIGVQAAARPLTHEGLIETGEVYLNWHPWIPAMSMLAELRYTARMMDLIFKKRITPAEWERLNDEAALAGLERARRLESKPFIPGQIPRQARHMSETVARYGRETTMWEYVLWEIRGPTPTFDPRAISLSID